MVTLNSKKAEMGVGTLIIFIALLLVAAVAAGVLLQTAGSLQQKALSTGTQATGQISTNAVALEVSATDGTATLDNFSAVMKLAPGSDAIKLDEVTYSLNTKNTTTTFIYSGGAVHNTSHFGVEYLQQGTNYQDGVLVRGDVIRMTFIAPRDITEGEDVRLSFIPKTGTPTVTMFTVPDVVSTQRVYMYP